MNRYLPTFHFPWDTGNRRKTKSIYADPVSLHIVEVLALQNEQITLNWKKEKKLTQLRHLQNVRGNGQTKSITPTAMDGMEMARDFCWNLKTLQSAFRWYKVNSSCCDSTKEVMRWGMSKGQDDKPASQKTLRGAYSLALHAQKLSLMCTFKQVIFKITDLSTKFTRDCFGNQDTHVFI